MNYPTKPIILQLTITLETDLNVSGIFHKYLPLRILLAVTFANS